MRGEGSARWLERGWGHGSSLYGLVDFYQSKFYFLAGSADHMWGVGNFVTRLVKLPLHQKEE